MRNYTKNRRARDERAQTTIGDNWLPEYPRQRYFAAPDEAGIWANPQTDPHKMPGADGAAAGVSPINSLDQLKTMSPDDINKNWADVQKLLAQQ